MVGNLALKIDNTAEPEIEINEAPLKWCSVSLSEMVDRGKRLEASVFDVEARQAYNVIEKCIYPTKNLIGDDGFVKNAHYGNRLKRRYVPRVC